MLFYSIFVIFKSEELLNININSFIMKKRTFITITSAFIVLASITSCSSSSDQPASGSTTSDEVETTEVAETKSGEELFADNGCVACHQDEAKTVGPSLMEISTAYSDNNEGLNKFLNGEGEAIVDPAQEAVMAPQLEVTKGMSAEERSALTEYILNK